MVFFKKLMQVKIYLWTALLIIVAAFLLPLVGGFLPNNEKTQSYSMVKYIEAVNETVFLNAGIQTVETQTNNTTIPWTKIGIPFSEKKAIIILNYAAKLGIKQPVEIKETSKNHYRIKLPPYEVIGVDLDKDNPYQLYDSRGELLSYSTKEIDTGELVTQNLSSKEQEKYLKQYTQQLNDSAKDYYTSLFKPLGDDVVVEVVFPE